MAIGTDGGCPHCILGLILVGLPVFVMDVGAWPKYNNMVGLRRTAYAQEGISPITEPNVLGFTIRSWQSANYTRRHYVVSIHNAEIAKELGIRKKDELLLLNCEPLVGKSHKEVTDRFRKLTNTVLLAYRRLSQTSPQCFSYHVVRADAIDQRFVVAAADVDAAGVSPSRPQWKMTSAQTTSSAGEAFIRLADSDVKKVHVKSVGDPTKFITVLSQMFHLGALGASRPEQEIGLLDLNYYLALSNLAPAFVVAIRLSNVNVYLEVDQSMQVTSKVGELNLDSPPKEILFRHVASPSPHVIGFSPVQSDGYYVSTDGKSSLVLSDDQSDPLTMFEILPSPEEDMKGLDGKPGATCVQF